jgi:anti-sigma factor RsiW
MRCEEACELISALVDHELPGKGEFELLQHIELCPMCARRVGDYRRMGRHIAGGYQQAPEGLSEKIRASIARERLADCTTRTFNWHPMMRQAAVLLCAIGLSALTTWYVMRSSEGHASLQHDVLAAHIRWLVQDRPIQVASSDGHTVKPWFNGRVDFAPPVKDLTANGFPLIGGRVDFVDDRRVAAVVYQRRERVITVFMWPDTGSELHGAQLIAANGYNIVTWGALGTVYWAVSDLNAVEMSELQNLLGGGKRRD